MSSWPTVHHFARVADAAPGHVGDVQQAVDAAEVDERAVLGDVLDHAVDDGAFLQRFHQLGALFAHRGFDHGAARQHDVVALAVELDDLELHGLVFVRASVSLTGRVSISEPGRKARMPLTSTVRPPLTLPLMVPVTNSPDSSAFSRRHPRGQALGLVARQDGVAVAVFDGVDGDRDEIADLDFDFALVVLEFVDRNVGFGLEAGVDDHEVVLDADDFGGDHFAGAHFGALQRFLEQGGKRFMSIQVPCTSHRFPSA